MRKDMAKVIVERPRRGSRGPFKHGRGKNIPLDQLPTRIGIRRSEFGAARECRSFNEHLGPLKRYLRKQVGRRWDDVYQDISAHLRVTSAVQQHVRDHVRWEVERLVEVGAKGRVWALRDIRWVGGRWRELRRGELYVDPRSGVLKVVKRALR